MVIGNIPTREVCQSTGQGTTIREQILWCAAPRRARGGASTVANTIWTVLTILFVLWLIGLIAHIGGSLINLLLVIVVIGVVYNLFTTRRPV